MSPIPTIAAIVHAADEECSALLHRFSLSARDSGYRVKGIVQCLLQGALTHKDAELCDLETGQRFPLFQNLGAGSVSCSVDARGLAAASVALRRITTADTDLAVINRFGALEMENGGFAAEMLWLMSEGIPLLTLVSQPYLEGWRQFTGHCAMELAADMQAIEAWFAACLRQRQP